MLILGGLISVAYASSTIITDTGITTTNLTILGTCSGCGGLRMQVLNYTGDGVFGSHKITVQFQPKLIHIVRMDATSTFAFITTNTTNIGVSANSGGSTWSNAGKDSGIFTSSTYVDVGKLTVLTNTFTPFNNNAIVYQMTVMG